MISYKIALICLDRYSRSCRA